MQGDPRVGDLLERLLMTFFRFAAHRENGTDPLNDAHYSADDVSGNDFCDTRTGVAYGLA